MNTPPQSKLTDSVTLEQAFWVMQHFLEAYWRRGGGHPKSKPSETTDIAGLLGSISILPDGTPVDSAQFFDWLRAADVVTHEGKGPIKLQLKRK